jgi:hypothetical protein
MNRIFLCLLLVAAFAFPVAGQTDRMKETFKHPPDEARPWVYWVWMDGNLTREGITADLESMRQAGIGGVIIMEVNVGIPRGPIAFMSTEWRSHFKHVVAEAKRLGLEITLMTGPGWAGSGGPWVKPEESMVHLVASDTTVLGPLRFDATLPRPKRWPAFFGDRHLPADIEKKKNEFYRDVTVLAFPATEGNERIQNINEKALYERAPYSSQPNVKSFFPTSVAFPRASDASVIAPSGVVDLSGKMAAGGKLMWDVPPGRWTIMRFGNTSTGATTRPAPVPGLGLECDKLDTTALNNHFDAFIGSLLQDIGPDKANKNGGWKWIHMDSWEMSAQNWTYAFREEFRRLRGYDLFPYLPAMTGRIIGGTETSERFLWDLRQTAQDLLLNNHAHHLKELGRRNGFQLSIEPYDMTPCSDMVLGGVADVPMCEFWMYGFNTFYSVFEAASIAHTNGKSVLAAEAFTSLDTEHWFAYPANMKTLGDWAFSSGINRFVFHRSQHQPWLNLVPGMTMGPFGVHWERTQTWWPMASGYHSYLTRCQYMLRQGLPVADVCFLVAEGAPHVFRPPSSATKGNPPDHLGYSFDGCAPDVALSKLSVRDGRLVLPDGMSYRVLVLPEIETMTPALLKKVKSLVEAGATVIGPRVLKSPSLSDYPRCDAEVKKLADALWGSIDGVNTMEHRVGKGRVVWKKSALTDSLPSNKDTAASPEQYGDFAVVVSTLKSMGVVPDFESDAALRYIHRKVGTKDVYFVANPANEVVTARCRFRVTGKGPEWWDGTTGDIRALPDFSEDSGQTTLTLRLEPTQSCFVVFSPRSGNSPVRGHNNPPLIAASVLDGSWSVLFDQKRGGPGLVMFGSLVDWTSRPEHGICYYSGIATYSTSFELPGNPKLRRWIDLGTVYNMARVRVNGRDLGVVWCPPWRVEITTAVQGGVNKIEIDVANLWPNRLIGDELQPPDAEYGKNGGLLRWPGWLLKNEPRPSTERRAFATWKHFTKDTPLLPSGLLGPVRVMREE